MTQIMPSKSHYKFAVEVLSTMAYRELPREEEGRRPGAFLQYLNTARGRRSGTGRKRSCLTMFEGQEELLDTANLLNARQRVREKRNTRAH